MRLFPSDNNSEYFQLFVAHTSQLINLVVSIMKKVLPNLLLALFAFTGCQEETDSEIIECVGASFYYLENHSKSSFSVGFEGPVLNNQIDSVTIVEPGERSLIGQDAEFGSIPTPVTTFSTFTLYADKGGSLIAIYRQDPVQNNLWRMQKHHASNPDFGCEKVDYTLTVSDDMLK
ncbi:hypothetical protein IQ277_32715 [Nostocales cyanobacterium LEGE 12452]|nr:hypothetical protein [Nostocales cyanobacterium LEGE 12452]